MRDNVSYWYHKLDRIQYAIDFLTRVKNGASVDRLISHLEEAEAVARQDLVEAEAADEMEGE